VKDPIYAEVVAASLRSGVKDGVIVKTKAGPDTPPLSGMPPYNAVPFAVIPVSSDASGADLPTVIDRQMKASPRPVAIELPTIPLASLPLIIARAHAADVRVWVNTLNEGFVLGGFGDLDALRSPQAVWGRLCKMGVSVFQTDEPAALLRYRAQLKDKCVAPRVSEVSGSGQRAHERATSKRAES
jgi:glycerophosphoryl diester phosphodiesterase